jgi:endoglucanase
MVPRIDATPLVLKTFESGSAFPVASPPWERVTEKGRGGVLCARAKRDDGWITTRLELDPSMLRGQHIQFSAWTRADSLSARRELWNGVKVVLDLEDSAGNRYQPQLDWPLAVAQWDWTYVLKRYRIPANLSKASIGLGLEKVSGTVSFDSIRIDRIAPAFAPAREKPRSVAFRFGLRGAMVESRVLDSIGLPVLLKKWGANVLRWQFNPSWPRDSGLLDSRFFEDLDANMNRLDSVVRIVRPTGARILLDFHGMGRQAFHDSRAQERIVEAWERIARRYRDVPEVWGYDLLNEPDERSWKPGLLLWDELADSIGLAIRRVDRRKILVVQPADFGEAKAFVWQKPLGWKRGYDLDPVVYSFHFYAPGELTHQGVFDQFPMGPRYPGLIAGEIWNKERLRIAMRPALEFQRRYHVGIFVGEFACVRWAPDGSTQRWMRDAIELFEEAGWDWTYHAFREWQGWDLERGQSRGDTSKVDHPAGGVVREYFRRNHP